jgi:AcrR family transcriptional regulator
MIDERREQNKLEKLRRIVASARELFHEKGFELTTTQEVAQRANVGSGTLFLYVSTKEDLLILAFVDEMVEVVEHSYKQVDRRAPVLDQACGFLNGVFGYHTADIRLTKYLLREVSVVRNTDLLADVRRLPVWPLLTAIVRDAQARGELRSDVNPSSIADLMFAAFWDCLREWVNGALTEAQFKERLRSMISLQMGGVGPLQARSEPARPSRVGRRWAARRKPRSAPQA